MLSLRSIVDATQELNIACARFMDTVRDTQPQPDTWKRCAAVRAALRKMYILRFHAEIRTPTDDRSQPVSYTDAVERVYAAADAYLTAITEGEGPGVRDLIIKFDAELAHLQALTAPPPSVSKYGGA